MNKESRTLQEELLHAWMQMSVFIRRNRLLAEFSFNEMMICGLLYRRQESGATPLTATELGEQTNLLKSQINHILTQMEQRGWIERIRSTSDKRVIYVHLSDLGRESYLKEHAKVLEILNTVHRELGSEKTLELTTLLNRATSIVHAYERNH